jgi:PIN domain nuclease of toxin-antitoxin system
LLDTHFIIWLATNQSEIEPREWALLNNPANAVLASTISIWEIRIKWNSTFASGTRKGSIDPIAAYSYLRAIGLDILTLDPETAATPLLVPITHKDPFDELLLVQAQQAGARLLTRDRALLEHPLAYQSV